MSAVNLEKQSPNNSLSPGELAADEVVKDAGNKKLLFVLAIFLVIISSLGIFLYFQNQSLKSQLGLPIFKFPWTRVTCTYNGQIYQAGESVPSIDGCNSCSCDESGQVACTDMACEKEALNQVNATIDWKTYTNSKHGYSFSYPFNLFPYEELDQEVVGPSIHDTKLIDRISLYSFDRNLIESSIPLQCANTNVDPDDWPKKCLLPVLQLELQTFSKTEYPTMDSVFKISYVANTTLIENLVPYYDAIGREWKKVEAITTPILSGFQFFHEDEKNVYSLLAIKDVYGFVQYQNTTLDNPLLLESIYTFADYSEELNFYFDPIIDKIISSFDFSKNQSPHNAMLTLQGKLTSIERPSPEINYDFLLELVSPYFDELNAQGPRNITSIVVVPQNETIRQTLAANIDKSVEIEGIIEWGLAETRHLKVTKIVVMPDN